ncbi:Hypothetical protein NTJ_04600 [Nesidiocoris tenuis]|uniref:Uncharacterized protein n=1 Tax=Nesidiocoris tenuis TaxID=355587 RepID=A0ABN7AN43_9HEMI|nr:Hypothetical protein NTJ_04600 [Nesidiocoris tenuis]
MGNYSAPAPRRSLDSGRMERPFLSKFVAFIAPFVMKIHEQCALAEAAAMSSFYYNRKVKQTFQRSSEDPSRSETVLPFARITILGAS